MKRSSVAASAALVAVMCGASVSSTAAAGDAVAPIQNGTIGYVLTERHWAVLQSEGGKKECPNGFNLGPREQFKLLFPEDGTKRTIMETHIAREGETWHPSTSKEPYPFYEAQGPIALGMDLDGKVGAEDFTSPDGEKGVDNQLYRAIGCISNYRGPEGTAYHFENKFMQQFTYNRILVEITGVDSIVNDDDVTVNTYRGMDDLLTDSTGEPVSGGSQRVDLRWGKDFRQTFHGKIKDGVLTTDTADFVFPWTGQPANTNPLLPIRDVRFRLRLAADRAEGLMGGYVDLMGFYYNVNTNWSTHHQSYGQESSPSLYRALRKVADAYPDAQGVNTAVSASVSVKFKQVFIVHPPAAVAQNQTTPAGEKPVATTQQR